MGFSGRESNELHREIASYWDRFYSEDQASPTKESDFARWVTARVPNIDGLVEFGCGTGRDSVWFARAGIGLVIATDASREGLAKLRRRVHDSGPAHIFTLQVDLNSPKSLAELSGRFHALTAERKQYAQTMFYARFLLHAIDESAQAALLEFAVSHLRTGDSLAVEYRAAALGKGRYVFGDHYRRPIDPEKFEAQCVSAGFNAVRTYTSDSFSVLDCERPLIGRTLAER